MSRRAFIERHGATCANWTWSWSFVNHRKRFVIFGEWQSESPASRGLILAESWEYLQKKSGPRRQPGYYQAREHVDLVSTRGYRLFTFPQEHADTGEDKASIKRFVPRLTPKKMVRRGARWYAISVGSDLPHTAEEIDPSHPFWEGGRQQVYVNKYERDPKARARCLAEHGYACVACGFDFQRTYGAIGERYIHVHHLTEVHRRKRRYRVHPTRDLVPICPNCHAMVHTSRPCLTVSQLKACLGAALSRKGKKQSV